MGKQRIYLQISLLLMAVVLISSCAPSTAASPNRELESTIESATITPRQNNPIEGFEETATKETATQENVVDHEREYQIITVLPKDAIPSIDNPRFYSVPEADEEYASEELVIGVEFDGEARAYSIPLLSSYEIVNDTVAGRAIAVTW
jgi:hypothetical protein